MIWPLNKIPFFKDKVTVYRYRLIDWNKVKTTQDLAVILQETGLLKTVQVSDSCWNHPVLSKLLSDEVITRTYVNDRLKEDA